MEAEKKLFLKIFLQLLFFYSCCFSAFLIFENFLSTPASLIPESFLNWDAMHYDAIRRHGYATGMVAFFPLFPFLWKISFLGSIGISILNGFVFLLAFSWLAVLFKIVTRRLLMLASVPCLIFMFLPYSEAVFFLSCTILIAGLQKNNYALLIAGTFLAGLTRPVSTVFIPAFIVLSILAQGNPANEIRSSLKMILVCLLSLLVVFVIQYFQTGEWFSFFRIQKEWGNYLRLPSLPLNSWAGGFILRLDSIAFFTGISSLAYLIFLFMKKIRHEQITVSRPVVFSLCYLALLTFIILFTRGGVLNSLNRYLFCSVFFIIALNEILTRKIFSTRNALILFFLSGLCWLIFGSYVHIQTTLKFMLLTVYLLLLLCSSSENRNIRNAGYFSVMACNVFFMVLFFHRFLAGEWVA